MSRTHLLAAALGALIAGVLAGGIAWGAIGDGGVIQGCYDAGGNLKVVAALACPKGYTSLLWNQKGDPGPKGDKGDAGPSHVYTAMATPTDPSNDVTPLTEADTLLVSLQVPAGPT
jgi:hypothetical protein